MAVRKVSKDDWMTDPTFVRVGKWTGKGWNLSDLSESKVAEGGLRTLADGNCFFAPRAHISKANAEGTEPILHDPFPPDAREEIDLLARDLADVRPWSAFDWEEFLQARKCPWAALAHWQVARTVTDSVAQAPISRSDVFHTIMRIWYGPSKPAGAYGTVTAKLAAEITATVRGADMQTFFRERVAANRVLMAGTPTGPAYVTLAGLTDGRGGVNLTASFDPIELLAVAPVVVAARVETGPPVAIFRPRSRPARSRHARTAAGAAEVEYLCGAELPAEYLVPTPALPAGTLSVLVDSDEELTELASLVQTARGPMVDGRRRLHPNKPGPLLPTGVYEE